MFQKLLSVVLTALLVLIGIIPSGTSCAQDKNEYTIAVLDLDADGISQAEAKSLSNNLRVQVTRAVISKEYNKTTNIRYTVVERSQMDKIFDQFEIESTGCTDLSCAVEFGKMLSVERIIIGSVGLVGGTYTLNASIVDVETAATLHVADYVSRGAIDNLLNEGIPSIINELVYGKKQKKSRKIYYIVGGAVLIGGILAAVIGSSSGGDGDDNTGTITFTIPDPSE